MKNWLLAFYLLFQFINPIAAQTPLDTTSSFEDQRQRVNNLLNERSKKFGEYDISLQQKSGVFGLFKSKNDLQNSIDILKQIVLNDNNIFVETRKLLELKDSEKERFQELATEYDQQITAYMKTISKLEAENDKLRENITGLEDEYHNSSKYLYLLILVIIGLAITVIYLYRQLKLKNVTIV